MDLSTKTMDIIFRRVLPERVIEGIICEDPVIDASTHWFNRFTSKNRFLQVAESALSGYSLDEQELIYNYILRRVYEDTEGARRLNHLD